MVARKLADRQCGTTFPASKRAADVLPIALLRLLRQRRSPDAVKVLVAERQATAKCAIHRCGKKLQGRNLVARPCGHRYCA